MVNILKGDSFSGELEANELMGGGCRAKGGGHLQRERSLNAPMGGVNASKGGYFRREREVLAFVLLVTADEQREALHNWSRLGAESNEQSDKDELDK